MTRYAHPDNIDTLRCLAAAEVAENEHVRGHCDCTTGETCWPHRVLSLTEPMVEAHETPWGVAS